MHVAHTLQYQLPVFPSLPFSLNGKLSRGLIPMLRQGRRRDVAGLKREVSLQGFGEKILLSQEQLRAE